MTQTLPTQSDTRPDSRTVRSDRCRGEGGWTVRDPQGDDWWSACTGCCTCRPDRYRAPAKVAAWKTAQVYAPADIEF